MKRNKSIDVMRGILIFFVVVAHYNRDIVHDVIFLFHMPLFFILSGLLLNKEKIKEVWYVKNKANSLIIPYIVYLVLDFSLIRRNFTIKETIRTLWGGRVLAGTYWYITCFIASLFLFSLLLRHFSDKVAKCLIVMGGGIAIVESHLMNYIKLLESPGIPWNLDVVLLALVYLSIGFYNKKQILNWLYDSNWKYNLTALATTFLLAIFCVFNYRRGRCLYYFDMKPIYYKELILAVVIPCAFGMICCRFVYWIERCKIMNWVGDWFAYLGRMTIPIMFMHIPLNTWKELLGYGRLFYILIGVGFPVIFTILFSRFKPLRRIFGLPNLKN